MDQSNIRKELKQILDNYKGKPNTTATQHELHERLNDFFFRHNLHDLQWRLSSKDNVIVLHPIRTIDELALLSLMEQPKEVTSYVEHNQCDCEEYTNLFTRWRESDDHYDKPIGGFKDY